MNTPRETIGRLEALLARIQRRAAEPRVDRAPRMEMAAEPIAERAPQRTAPEAGASEVEDVTVRFRPIAALEAPQPILEEPAVSPPPQPPPPPEEVDPPPVTVAGHVPEYRAAPERERERDEEPFVEAVSGEFAVAAPVEMPFEMELEELGPADEEETVEIHIDEPVAVAPSELVIDTPREDESPPESGRELVAAPHESARVAVAAPAEEVETPDEPPPESARNLKVAPSTPVTSDVFDLEPPLRIEAAPAFEPFEPQKLVDVVRPTVSVPRIAADVAAFIEAARAPRPETFGILLDAALDL